MRSFCLAAWVEFIQLIFSRFSTSNVSSKEVKLWKNIFNAPSVKNFQKTMIYVGMFLLKEILPIIICCFPFYWMNRKKPKLLSPRVWLIMLHFCLQNFSTLHYVCYILPATTGLPARSAYFGETLDGWMAQKYWKTHQKKFFYN